MTRRRRPGAARRRRGVAWCAQVAATGTFLALATPAGAAGLRRLDSAWLLPAPLEAVLLGADRDLAARGGAWVRASQASLYGLPELPARLLAVGGARAGWAAEAAWETLGTGVLRDDRLGGRMLVGRGARLGLRVERRTLQPGPGDAGRSLAVDLEMALSGTGAAGSSWSTTLQWPLLRRRDAWLGPEPESRLRAAVAAPGRALALALEVAADGSPALGWEAQVGLGGGVALSWRSDPATGSGGGGLLWRRGRLRLRTSHLAHPELGLTHRVEVCIGRSGAAPW